MQALFARLAAPGRHASPRARPSRSSTASPSWPRINAHLRHKAANLRSVALDAGDRRRRGAR